MKISNPFPHGIDITAPGGIDQLIEFHRGTFGGWQMNANGDGGAAGSSESGGDGGGGDSGDEHGAGDDGAGESGDDGNKGLRSALAAERKASKDATAALAAAEARVKELEDASKSEEQRQQEAQEKRDADLQKATSELAAKDLLIQRYEVAADKGLDLKAARRLQGSSREELESDADDLIALLGGAERQSERRGDPGQGARGNAQESSFAKGAERGKARFGEQQ